MPILNLPVCVGCGEDVAGLVVAVFWAPHDVGEGGLAVIGDGVGQVPLLGVEHLDGAVLAGWVRQGLPAAMYLSWGSNLMEWILTSGSPSVKR